MFHTPTVYFMDIFLYALSFLDFGWKELVSLKQFYSCARPTMWFLLDWAVHPVPICFPLGLLAYPSNSQMLCTYSFTLF